MRFKLLPLVGLIALAGAACGSDAAPKKIVTNSTTTVPVALTMLPAVTTTAAPTTTPPPATAAPTTARPVVISPPATSAPTTTPASVSYANCAAVKAAGKAPLYRGQPGYSTALDRDGDGVACEA